MALLDTGGLGVGLGSSRASSWLLAVLSQLGVLGTILLGILVLEIFKRPYRDPPAPREAELAALCMSMRAAAFATVVSLFISAGNADPGIFFFASLATLLVGRTRLRGRGPVSYSHMQWRADSLANHRV
jgi:O-antigen ligase